MTGFKLLKSGVGGDRSTNCATTVQLVNFCFTTVQLVNFYFTTFEQIDLIECNLV